MNNMLTWFLWQVKWETYNFSKKYIPKMQEERAHQPQSASSLNALQLKQIWLYQATRKYVRLIRGEAPWAIAVAEKIGDSVKNTSSLTTFGGGISTPE
jgi:hypothetical protein